jgi:hypothetical protein
MLDLAWEPHRGADWPLSVSGSAACHDANEAERR